MARVYTARTDLDAKQRYADFVAHAKEEGFEIQAGFEPKWRITDSLIAGFVKHLPIKSEKQRIDELYQELMMDMMKVVPLVPGGTLRAFGTPIAAQVRAVNGGRCPDGYRFSDGECVLNDPTKVSPEQFARINAKMTPVVVAGGSGSSDRVEVVVDPKNPPNAYFRSSTPNARGEERRNCMAGYSQDMRWAPDIVCVRKPERPVNAEELSRYKRVISPRALVPGAPLPVPVPPLRRPTPFAPPARTPFGMPYKVNGTPRRVCPNGYSYDKERRDCARNGKPVDPEQWGFENADEIPAGMRNVARLYEHLWNSLATTKFGAK